MKKIMTNQEIVKRLSRLDIRDAEPEDYAALYFAVELIKTIEEKEDDE